MRLTRKGQGFSALGGADWAHTSTSWPSVALARAISSENMAMPPRTGYNSWVMRKTGERDASEIGAFGRM